MTTSHLKTVLIINPFGIGDVLFTTPLIKNLKQQIPDISIGYLANTRVAKILKIYSLLDRVFVYDRDEFHRCYHRSKAEFLRQARRLLGEIRAQRYDAVIDLSLAMPTGFLMALAGIQERIGFDYRGRGRFLTTRIPLAGYEGRHVVEHYLDLLRRLGIEAQPLAMDFPMEPDDRRWAADIFHRYQLDSCVIAIVPGGGASWGREANRKRWPLQRFAELADRLVETYGAKILLIGGPEDKSLSQTIQSRMTNTVLDFTGDLTPAQSAALFAKSHLVITNDGGPLHMAVAAGARTLSIFGPVDERVYGPYPAAGHVCVSTKIPCRPCYHRFRVAQCAHCSCLQELPVEEVFQRVKDVL